MARQLLQCKLAYAAARDGLRVLAVDLDPQSNLSQSIMGPRGYTEHLREHCSTVAQVFDDYIPAGGTSNAPQPIDMDKVIVKNTGSSYTNGHLDLIPSRLELSRTLKNPTGKERRLVKGLSRVSNQYDLIVIDCAPTESILTVAAYFASRYVIIPVKPEFMATIGLPLLARSIEEFRLENDDHEIDIAGLVFNHSSSYSEGPEGKKSIIEVRELAEQHGWPVLRKQIKYSASYPKAAREAAPLSHTSYAHCHVIEDFDELKDEIFGALGISKVKET